MSLSLKQLKEENEKLRRDLQESNQARDEEKKRYQQYYWIDLSERVSVLALT